MTSPIVLVTAGGSGMGAAVATHLASRGYTLGILSPSGKGEALAIELGGFGLTGSNTNPEDLDKFMRLACAQRGEIVGLVNSAGHGPKGDLLALSDEDWQLGMETYFLNVVRMCRLITPSFLKRGGGAIVNISTFATFEPESSFPTSGAFRASLAAFTKLYADRYAADNIRMNNILPGFIDSLPEKPHFKERIPMGRYGTVTEIAATAEFLLSSAAGYITGQNIRVDGGITRSL